MTARPRWPRLATSGLLAAALGLTVVLVTGGAASAHVSVSPETVPMGSTAELTFRVPNEESKADTTEISILVPTQHPIAQVLARPVPGWTVTEKTTKLAKPLVTDDGKFTSVVSQVTWRGGRIQPGEYQDFSLSADPLPDQPTTLVFKTLQTYSNGDVVRWIDVPQAGQGEPEHPAPSLTVAAASGVSSGGSGGGSSDGSSDGSGTAPTANTSSGSGTADPATWPGYVAVAALVLSLLALVVAGAVRRSRPRR